MTDWSFPSIHSEVNSCKFVQRAHPIFFDRKLTLDLYCFRYIASSVVYRTLQAKRSICMIFGQDGTHFILRCYLPIVRRKIDELVWQMAEHTLIDKKAQNPLPNTTVKVSSFEGSPYRFRTVESQQIIDRPGLIDDATWVILKVLVGHVQLWSNRNWSLFSHGKVESAEEEKAWVTFGAGSGYPGGWVRSRKDCRRREEDR